MNDSHHPTSGKNVSTETNSGNDAIDGSEIMILGDEDIMELGDPLPSVEEILQKLLEAEGDENIKDDLLTALQKRLYKKRAGFTGTGKSPHPRKIGGDRLLMTIRIAKETFARALGVSQEEIEKTTGVIRDGVYLVLNKPFSLSVFGRKQAEAISQDKKMLEKMHGRIQSKEEFEEYSEIAEKITSGSDTRSKEIQGGLIAQVIVKHANNEIILLVLKSDEGIFKFGESQAKNLTPDQIKMHYESIQNTEDFDYFSKEAENEQTRKEFEKEVEAMGGAMLDCEPIEGGMIAQVLITDDVGETLFLILKSVNGLSKLGGKRADKIDQKDVPTYYNAIKNTEQFRQLNSEIEAYRD